MAKSKNPHFDDKFISEQKALLLKFREQTINDIGQKSNDDLHVDSDEVIEDGDQAQTYLNQNLSFGLRERSYEFEEYEKYYGDSVQVKKIIEDCPCCGSKFVMTHAPDAYEG